MTSSKMANKILLPVKAKRIEEKITVLLIGSNPCDGLKSKPAIGTLSINSHYPVIDCQAAAILSAFPNADIINVAGHDVNRLVRFRPRDVRIVENQNFKSTGEMEDIRMGLNSSTTDSILIISNNILFNTDTLRQLKMNSSCIIVGPKNLKKDKIGLTHINYWAENIAFGIGNSIYNFIYLKQPELSIMRRSANAKNRKTSYLFEGISDIIKNGGRIRVVQNHQYLQAVTSLGELN
jgi:hypothetical protein